MSGKDGRLKLLCRKTEMCRFYQRGQCTRGDKCNFAHEADEVRSKPNLHCTKSCPTMAATGVCNDAQCPFAHKSVEQRKYHPPLGQAPARLESQSGSEGRSERKGSKCSNQDLPYSRSDMKRFHSQPIPGTHDDAKCSDQDFGATQRPRALSEVITDGTACSDVGSLVSLAWSEAGSSRQTTAASESELGHGEESHKADSKESSKQETVLGIRSGGSKSRCFDKRRFNSQPDPSTKDDDDNQRNLCPEISCSLQTTVASESELGHADELCKTGGKSDKEDKPASRSGSKSLCLDMTLIKSEPIRAVKDSANHSARVANEIHLDGTASVDVGSIGHEATLATDSEKGRRDKFYKTRMCSFYMAGECKQASCKFAHGAHELRSPPSASDHEPTRPCTSAEPNPQPTKNQTEMEVRQLPACVRVPASPLPRKLFLAQSGLALSSLPLLAGSTAAAATATRRRQRPLTLLQVDESSSEDEDSGALRSRQFRSEGCGLRLFYRGSSLSDSEMLSPSEARVSETSQLVVKNTFLTMPEDQQEQAKRRCESAPPRL